MSLPTLGFCFETTWLIHTIVLCVLLAEVKPPLDSSLKKHTTLLNRLRSALLTTSADTFLKELDGLTLTKYTEEIRAAVLEGISGTAAKGKADVEGAVEVGLP